MLKKVFLSYCEKDTCIADIIERSLQEQLNGIVAISRYTRDVAYKESFKIFMNSIGLHDFVLSIVSDSYLKSMACMYEVGEILKDRSYAKKFLYVVLNEEERKYYPLDYKDCIQPNIYNPTGRLEYILYWQEKYVELKKKLDCISEYEAKRQAIDDLAVIKGIKDFDIAPFMAYLSDLNGKTFSSLKDNNFSEIISIILQEFSTNIFNNCKSCEEVLEIGIKRLYSLSMTDYNQIVLFENLGSHTSGLIVVADIISTYKQHYRQVAVDGLISRAFQTSEIINISNVECCEDYFPAVKETKSELIVPIIMGRACIGVLNVESDKMNYFNPTLQNQIALLANLIGVAFSKLEYSGFKRGDVPYISLFCNKSKS